MIAPPGAKEDIVSKTIFADMSGSSTTDTTGTQGTGMYLEYSPITVQQALDSGQRVVLFFYASRDPICRQIDQDIQAKIAELPSDVAVFKVDYDKQNDLKQKYDVKTQYTLVMLDKQQNKTKFAVGPSFQALLNFVQ